MIKRSIKLMGIVVETFQLQNFSVPTMGILNDGFLHHDYKEDAC